MHGKRTETGQQFVFLTHRIMALGGNDEVRIKPDCGKTRHAKEPGVRFSGLIALILIQRNAKKRRNLLLRVAEPFALGLQTLS